MILVYVTCASASEAEKIGKALVEKRLAACAVVVPRVKSFFMWKGKLGKKTEALLFLKASASAGNKKRLEKEILRMHSYETPCILFFKPQASKNYAAWAEGKN